MPKTAPFLPHCMECRCGLTMRFCLSVRLSVCLTRALWQNGRKICLDCYTVRKIIYPSFLRRRMVGGSTPSTLKFGSTGPHWSEINFEPIIAHSASAIIHNEKSSINTNRKSPSTPTHFPISLRWSLYVAPKSPKGGLKNGLHLKKVCYKVYSCENSQWQSCRHSLA